MSDAIGPPKSAQQSRLIIVYNADEGWASALTDAAHKFIRPETYQCNLCMISYSALSMRRPWRKYLNRLPMETHLYHRQDFFRAYPADFFPIVEGLHLPAMLMERAGELRLLLAQEQLDGIADVESLIAATDLALVRIKR